MSSSNSFLKTVDVNVLPLREKSLHLPKPPQRRLLTVQLDEQRPPRFGADISSPLSYAELQRRLRDVLLRVEIMQSSASGPEERRHLLHAEFSRLLAAADEEACALLSPLFRRWADLSDVPLSYQVLEVLKRRRRVLCGGFELGLCEFKEWILLSRVLGEPGLAELAAQYAKELGPFSRQRVEDTIKLFRGGSLANTAALSRALLSISAPATATTPFDARYLNFVLEDLIAMADAAPVALENAFSLREPLVEWMLQICVAAGAQLETFFLSVAVLDRILIHMSLGRDRLHLFACAALLLASKQEEIFPIPLRSLVRYGGDRFNIDELVATECQIFALLGFDVVCPTLSALAMAFAAEQEPATCNGQKYFLLYTAATLAVRINAKQFRISSMAAAAVYFSRVCFHIPTGAPSAEIKELLPVVAAALQKNNPGSGLHEIFSRTAFGEATRIHLPGNLL